MFRYLSFNFEEQYIYFPVDLSYPAQIRNKTESLGVSDADLKDIVRKHPVVIGMQLGARFANHSGNVTLAWVKDTRNNMMPADAQNIVQQQLVWLHSASTTVAWQERPFDEFQCLTQNGQNMLASTPHQAPLKCWFQVPPSLVSDADSTLPQVALLPSCLIRAAGMVTVSAASSSAPPLEGAIRYDAAEYVTLTEVSEPFGSSTFSALTLLDNGPTALAKAPPVQAALGTATPRAASSCTDNPFAAFEGFKHFDTRGISHDERSPALPSSPAPGPAPDARVLRP